MMVKKCIFKPCYVITNTEQKMCIIHTEYGWVIVLFHFFLWPLTSKVGLTSFWWGPGSDACITEGPLWFLKATVWLHVPKPTSRWRKWAVWLLVRNTTEGEYQPLKSGSECAKAPFTHGIQKMPGVSYPVFPLWHGIFFPLWGKKSMSIQFTRHICPRWFRQGKRPSFWNNVGQIFTRFTFTLSSFSRFSYPERRTKTAFVDL